jgi:hypothetical protein
MWHKNPPNPGFGEQGTENIHDRQWYSFQLLAQIVFNPVK